MGLEESKKAMALFEKMKSLRLSLLPKLKEIGEFEQILLMTLAYQTAEADCLTKQLADYKEILGKREPTQDTANANT